MPEWVIEEGIGETRAALISDERIVEARIVLDDVMPAGLVLGARLKNSSSPVIAVAGGQEYLLPNGAPGVAEGAHIYIEITRETIPGIEPWKRPLAAIVSARPNAGPPLRGRGLPFPAPRDEVEEAGWSDLLDEARSGIVGFPGGELRVSPTPAMTLIDVDGTLAGNDLALTGLVAAVRAIMRHGIGGSIGIDLPTVKGKGLRNAIAARVDDLLPQPFERTAINGFGFLQIVRPRRHASLFELAADRAGFEARALVRRAARSTGAVRLAAHPGVIALLEGRPEWLDALGRQVGGGISLRADPSLTMSGGHVEKA